MAEGYAQHFYNPDTSGDVSQLVRQLEGAEHGKETSFRPDELSKEYKSKFSKKLKKGFGFDDSSTPIDDSANVS